MKILIWSFPWASQGNETFYKNCLVNHLLIQANTLAEMGHSVDVLAPNIFEVDPVSFSEKIRKIGLSQFEFQSAVNGSTDMSAKLYQYGGDVDTTGLELLLRAKLSRSYDVILLWETPVPFLERMYPNALIVHQMPGAFSRAPYPSTVVFDPIGLYRHGMLALHSDEILHGPITNQENTLQEILKRRVKGSVEDISPYTRTSLDPNSQYKNLKLLPLQVSGHYAFLADTGFRSQQELLEEVMANTPADIGVVVTQYVHGHARDLAVGMHNLIDIRNRWPNVIYDPAFDRFPSISQYLLPLVNEVVTCSSSVGLQALLWGKDLHVLRPTFLHAYATVGTERPDETARRVTNFCLERHQPLSEKVLRDGVFLTNLLEDLLRKKRSGATGLESTASFLDIEGNYASTFEKSINVAKAKRLVVRERPDVEERIADSGKFARAVSSSDINVISFDVFDTLIYRPVETPADVYAFLERAVAEELGNLAEGFSKVRLSAEVTVRKNSDKGEITLDDIYSYISDYYGLDDDVVKRLKEIELNLELSFVRPRPFGRLLFDIAKKSNKSVILISDMYLPSHHLSLMLEKCGYDKSSYHKLFVSSDYGVRKKEGGLYDVVLSHLNVDPTTMLHVGDNVVADIDESRKRGIKAFRIVRSLDRMRRNKLYYELFHPRQGAGEMGRSVIAGTLAAKLFEHPPVDGWDISLFGGDAYKLGYGGLGPVLLGFTQWLKRKAQDDGISELFFLSREGWILKAAYDVLTSGDQKSIPSKYLLASRRASRVAAILTKDDLASVAVQPYSAGITIGDLLSSRFGIDGSDIELTTLKDNGYTDLRDVLVADVPCKARFSKLCFAISDIILESSKKERQAYLKYLDDSGFIEASRPAVVDIGWKANMQASLGNLVGRGIDGYYFATLDGAQHWVSRGHRLQGYIGDFLSQSYNNEILNNRHVCEFLFCSSSKSLVSILQRNGELILNFRDEPGYELRRKLIDKMHVGAIDFCRDVKAGFSEYMEHIFVDPHTASKILRNYLSDPVALDAKILSKGAFEDGFGGVIEKGVLAAERSDSVWKAGFDVLNSPKRKLEKKSRVIDTSASSSRPHAKLGGRDSSVISGSGFEQFLVKTLCSQRIFNKYQRDREAFFRDSKSVFFRSWYKYLG